MFSRYRVIEDHEYHRSATIKRLRKSYSQEDKGLWDKSEIAIKKLEEQSSEQLKGRKGALIQAKMSGNIGSLNAESLCKHFWSHLLKLCSIFVGSLNDLEILVIIKIILTSVNE